MTTPTIYTTENCQQCRSTQRWLRDKGIPFKIDDATEPGNLAAIKALGYRAAPVIVYGPTENAPDTISFSGFDPGSLEHLRRAFEADHPQENLS